MVTSSTNDGPLSDSTIQALTRHAERQADLTAAYLNATGVFQSKPARLPAAFLLELAAVLELGLWERQGIRPYLKVDLPTHQEASRSLGERAKRGPTEFTDGETPLWIEILKVWLEHFAWDGPEFLATDVVIDDLNEDTFIDVIAEFVWKYRHELEQLVNGEVHDDKT